MQPHKVFYRDGEKHKHQFISETKSATFIPVTISLENRCRSEGSLPNLKCLKAFMHVFKFKSVIPVCSKFFIPYCS
jgi:hypothetical protein